MKNKAMQKWFCSYIKDTFQDKYIISILLAMLPIYLISIISINHLFNILNINLSIDITIFALSSYTFYFIAVIGLLIDRILKKIDKNLYLWLRQITILTLLILFIIYLPTLLTPFDEFLPIKANSAKYMISSLVQSEAAIIALVITLSLVGIQYSASSYSTKIIDIFSKKPDMWILIVIYLGSIVYGLYILKGIPETNINSSIEENVIRLFFINLIAFIYLLFYINSTLKLFKSSNLILWFGDKITPKSINDNLISTNLNFNEDNPYQKVIDITKSSIRNQNINTVKLGVLSIIDYKQYIINNDYFTDEEIIQIKSKLETHLEDLLLYSIKNNQISTYTKILDYYFLFIISTIENNNKEIIDNQLNQFYSTILNIGYEAIDKPSCITFITYLLNRISFISGNLGNPENNKKYVLNVIKTLEYLIIEASKKDMFYLMLIIVKSIKDFDLENLNIENKNTKSENNEPLSTDTFKYIIDRLIKQNQYDIATYIVNLMLSINDEYNISTNDKIDLIKPISKPFIEAHYELGVTYISTKIKDLYISEIEDNQDNVKYICYNLNSIIIDCLNYNFNVAAFSIIEKYKESSEKITNERFINANYDVKYLNNELLYGLNYLILNTEAQKGEVLNFISEVVKNMAYEYIDKCLYDNSKQAIRLLENISILASQKKCDYTMDIVNNLKNVEVKAINEYSFNCINDLDQIFERIGYEVIYHDMYDITEFIIISLKNITIKLYNHNISHIAKKSEKSFEKLYSKAMDKDYPNLSKIDNAYQEMKNNIYI
ncbi:hypothetical protein Metev_0339 [Methanohalobium evestigatum Z-7303]|uniref:Uncharacterized protein n=1 Tax=Methanohalobium evestigatum (strain ATCC BAA-1072 / DSM 3721 / NBRC 107634 / OCM 161 / Z-7303) TaxID=644295 RepID=D7E6P3_METEZ|nr:DUF2254 family protein [Methanohalobium evestigatum]ADI73265.1 hypothetical protein Metev_0339 [Methanohalobium evestigatum Z-7303]